jgi:quercetin dioxygenase-like cupin family protein
MKPRNSHSIPKPFRGSSRPRRVVQAVAPLAAQTRPTAEARARHAVRHRHLGEVHAFNVSGSRELDTGEIIGPGVYVYEPAGNVDSWRAVGDEPVIVHIASFGPMEYLDEHDSVLRRDDEKTLRDIYLRFCEENGLTPLELGQ